MQWGGVDVEAAATSVVVLAGAIAAAVAGIRAGLKKVRSTEADPGARITGGILMDNASMMMLSERLRDNTDATMRLSDELRETHHQLERVRDKL